MKYSIVSRGSINNLVTLVNEMMKQGWKPTGGVCYISETITHHELYAQALIKE